MIVELKRESVPFVYGFGRFEIPGFDIECLKDVFDLSTSYEVLTENQNFQKTEIRCYDRHRELRSLFEFPSCQPVVDYVQSFFPDQRVFFDPGYDGGGLTFTGLNGFLRYHEDFPFSSKVGAYRVFNLIFYLSTPEIDGGGLHLLDYESKTVERVISPERWTFVAFPTSKYSPHGFSRVKSGKRISLNAYFYSDRPIDDRTEPRKTVWL